MKKNTILLATSNLNKKNEYEEILSSYQLYTLQEKGIAFKVKENGKTFQENAFIKAKEAASFCNEMVLADDSGLIIDALPHILGVHSARFKKKKTYPEKCAIILKKMKNIKKRTARFVCTLCLITKEKEVYYFEGVCEGTIALSYQGENGFGYDPIFIPNGFKQTFAEMTEEEKNQISHRKKATDQLLKFLKERENEHIINQ